MLELANKFINVAHPEYARIAKYPLTAPLTVTERTFRESGNIRFMKHLFQQRKYTIGEIEQLTKAWMDKGGPGDPYYRTWVGEGRDFSIADWIDEGAVGDVPLGAHINRMLETARMERVSDYAADANFADADRIQDMTNTDYLRGYQAEVNRSAQPTASEEIYEKYALQESTGAEFLATESNIVTFRKFSIGDPADLPAGDTTNLGAALQGARREVFTPIVEDVDGMVEQQAELWGMLDNVIKDFDDKEAQTNTDYFKQKFEDVLQGDSMAADPIAKLDLAQTSNANLVSTLERLRESNVGELQEEYSQIQARMTGEEEKFETVLEQFESAEEQMGKWVRKARNFVRTGQIPEGNVEQIQDLLTRAEGVGDAAGGVRGATWEAGTNTTKALQNVGQSGLIQDVHNTYDVFQTQKWKTFWEKNAQAEGGMKAAEGEVAEAADLDMDKYPEWEPKDTVVYEYESAETKPAIEMQEISADDPMLPPEGVALDTPLVHTDPVKWQYEPEVTPQEIEMQEMGGPDLGYDPDLTNVPPDLQPAMGGEVRFLEPELGVPELGVPELGAVEAIVGGVGRAGGGFTPAMGAELMEDVVGGFTVGIADKIGLGGDLTALMEKEALTHAYQQELEHWDYWNRRDKRQTRLEQDWVKQKVYAKIGSFWYEGTVQNVFLGDTIDPDSYMGVTINWDDPSGRTMDYNIAASQDRIRLASDGEVPLREGGITKYEPFTNPELTMYSKQVSDIREMEQVKGDDGLYHEVKRIEDISTTFEGWERTGYKIIFTDGTSQEHWKDYIDWRPRGTIHTKERPKQPKYEWKTEWLKFLREEGLIPKNSDKKPGPKWRMEQRQRLMRKQSKTEKTSSLEDLRNAQIMSDFWHDDIDFYMGGYETQVDDEGTYQVEESGLDANAVEEAELIVEMRTDLEDALEIVSPDSEIAGYIWDTLETLGTLDQPAPDEVDELVLMAQNSIRADVDDEVDDEDDDEDEDEDDLDEPIGTLASAVAVGHDVTEEEAAALDATYTPITVGIDEPPTSNVTGHPLESSHPEGTEEHLQHIVETEGFRGLESYFGYDMPSVYENYALGNYSWQHDKEIPAWLQPDLTNIYGGSEQYKGLVKKYENDYQMSRNLERVGTAVWAPNVLRYLNKTHNEMKSLWHNGTLDADKIEQITQGNAPSFSYNSQGHIVLVNDTTIDHGFNHNRNMVHSFNDSQHQVTHSQLNFAKEAASFSKVETANTNQ